MKIRSFVIAYALVLAILLFADRRPGSAQQDRYSHVIDLTEGHDLNAVSAASSTRIIAPAALIPGTWAAGQIPAERLIAPLVVMDLAAGPNQSRESTAQISLDDIAAWEAHHGKIPQGAVVAIRRTPAGTISPAALPVQFPIAPDAAEFLIDARNTIGFALEMPLDLTSDQKFDRNLGRQLALHGDYVVAGAAPFTALPASGSLIIVAPSKDKKPGEVPVRILAMVH